MWFEPCIGLSMPATLIDQPTTNYLFYLQDSKPHSAGSCKDVNWDFWPKISKILFSQSLFPSHFISANLFAFSLAIFLSRFTKCTQKDKRVEFKIRSDKMAWWLRRSKFLSFFQDIHFLFLYHCPDSLFLVNISPCCSVFIPASKFP